MLKVPDMPRLPSITVPGTAYVVLKTPALLVRMRYPSAGIWQSLHTAGVEQLICLTDAKPSYDPSPVRLAHSARLEDLVHGGEPRDAAKEEEAIRLAAARGLDQIRRGVGVVIHCAGGRGRTGSVIGCILVGLGYQPEEVIRYLDSLHKSRGKPGWPESPWQAEVVRRHATI